MECQITSMEKLCEHGVTSCTPSQQGSSQSSPTKTRRSEGLEILDRLRNESFNVRTEKQLESHPFLQAAENGTLTLAQRRAFAYEQFAVLRAVLAPLASLAGYDAVDFAVRRLSLLTKAKLPDSICPTDADAVKDDPPDLFQFVLEGEFHAAPLLVDHARSVGIVDEASSSRKCPYELSPMAQAYPSYWSRLALSGDRVAGAAACAVNFPAWGRMCSRLARALSDLDHGYGYDGPNDPGLAFLKFFASPIEGLDDMAARIIEKEISAGGKFEYDDLVERVRLLQEYEVMFWDAVYATK